MVAIVYIDNFNLKLAILPFTISQTFLHQKRVRSLVNSWKAFRSHLNSMNKQTPHVLDLFSLNRKVGQ